MSQTIYKVRNRSNPELFHKGGVYNSWGKTGKIWPTLGQLRSFITLNMRSSYRIYNFDEWDIVEYEMTERSVKQVHEVVKTEKLIEILSK
jgi:hypothetical protein